MAESGKLWGGRFMESTDSVMHLFHSSISYDKRMWDVDILGSIAYIKALEGVHLVTVEESRSIQEGLNKVFDEWKSGRFVIGPSDEDIHSANERRLTELIGEVAGKLHAGRSRNDQVTTDMRMWLRESLKNTKSLLRTLIDTFLDRATAEIDIIIPGYTHLQKAQAIRWSHWLMCYASMLHRDLTRLDELVNRINICPLGSGALAGNPFPIDREFLAKELGFTAISSNSLDAVSDRDFVVEYLFWASMTTSHLSRWAEDLIIYSTKEFGFVTLSDAYSTGSSLMPQKKNPDSLELIRSKAGHIFGHCTALMMTIKALPMSYNKDLQEDKEAMFDTHDTMDLVIRVATGVLSTLKVNADNCKKSLSPDMLSTDLAYYLTRKGVPFREAHGLAGKCVLLAEKNYNGDLTKLLLTDLQSVSVLFSEDVLKIWNFENSVEQYCSSGGTSRHCVLMQIADMKSG